VAVSPCEKYLAAGYEDSAIRIYDFRTGDPIHVLRVHAGWVWGLRFSPDSHILYSTSRDCTVAAFSMPDGTCLRRERAHEDWIPAPR
jgi:WD40 repeat protein